MLHGLKVGQSRRLRGARVVFAQRLKDGGMFAKHLEVLAAALENFMGRLADDFFHALQQGNQKWIPRRPCDHEVEASIKFREPLRGHLPGHFMKQFRKLFKVDGPSPLRRARRDRRLDDCSHFHDLEKFVTVIVKEVHERAAKLIDVFNDDGASPGAPFNQASQR
ncbi:MAG TPA: hypothetical protein VMU98_01130 [Acidimicrobiales bacterium]|nr:hypothetical protein [Acidimicrobiales bacterium]